MFNLDQYMQSPPEERMAMLLPLNEDAPMGKIGAPGSDKAQPPTQGNIAQAQEVSAPGATLTEWDHFDFILGLTADLLPVVSDAAAKISPRSSMKTIGKTPSRYDSNGQVVGFPDWTSFVAKQSNIAKWSEQPTYGICLQTRTVRAIDVDVDDPVEALNIQQFIAERLGFLLPKRCRSNSAKFLVAFTLPGEFTKRKFKTERGIVEFLASGQQCIIAGIHPSGARYEWAGGLPDEFPTLAADQFEALWSALAEEFAIEAPTEASAASKAKVLTEAVHKDPIAQLLMGSGHCIKQDRDGKLLIICPFEDEHTGESSESSTVYFPAHTGGYERGHFDCKHAHCEHRSDEEFLRAIGYREVDFEDLTQLEPASPGADQPAADGCADKPRFRFLTLDEFCSRPRPTWIIKGVLPKAELGLLFGDSGSGKSFMALDMAAAIAQGKEWRGFKTKAGRVAFVAAEGAAGFQNRIEAYCQHHGIARDALAIQVLDAAPDLKDKAEAIDLAKAIKAMGGADLVVIDTFARALIGNENSGEDVGAAIKHCKGIHTATGALVLLIHHSGKDPNKGARGWSGLRAAADVELCVTREGEYREVSISKQKDGEDGARYGFQLIPHVLGLDEDGDAITSCTLIPADPPNKVDSRKLGTNQKIIVAVVNEIAEFQTAGIEIDAVITEAAKRIEKGDGPDRRRQKAKQALEYLCTGDAAIYCKKGDCLEIL